MQTSLKIALALFIGWLAATPAAAAALLIEGELGGEPLRILVDAETDRAEVLLGETRHRIDLDASEAQAVGSDGALGLLEQAKAVVPAPTPDIRPWGPGPIIAGHPSVYHVLMLDDQICGELLISPWMKPFVSPAVEALAILERIKGDHGIKAAKLDGPCGVLPFSSFAGAGWPLMAGGMNERIFTTEAISFDYDPNETELTWVRGGVAASSH